MKDLQESELQAADGGWYQYYVVAKYYITSGAAKQAASDFVSAFYQPTNF
ncbi:MAG: hypothetical protein AAF960_04550 [Bacteroidota bacterium]